MHIPGWLKIVIAVICIGMFPQWAIAIVGYSTVIVQSTIGSNKAIEAIFLIGIIYIIATVVAGLVNRPVKGTRRAQ